MNYSKTNGSQKTMTEMIGHNWLGDIKELIKDFKKYLRMPKHSHRAGEIFTLFKKLNKSLEMKK